MYRHFLPCLSIALLAAQPLLAAGDPASKIPPPVPGYEVAAAPANIAPTVATRTTPVEVAGQPRMTKGHPNTLWDQEDVNHYKELLKTNKELQLIFADLKDRMDKQLTVPVNIPPPQQGPDGKWLYPGDYYPPHPDAKGVDDPVTRYRRWFSSDAETVSDMGTMYALTGEEKYVDYAKKILMGRAVSSKLSAHPGFTMRSVIGMTGQLLDEALMMIKYARGYDLMYNSPTWTAEERKQLHDEFFRPVVECCLYPGAPDIDQKGSFATQTNNRGAIGICSVLMAGLATDDQELVQAALYGVHTEMTKPDKTRSTTFPMAKDWIAGSKEQPDRGLLTSVFAEDCIPGGMWVEGTPSYAFYALGSLIDSAEVLWHHGIDLYRHNNAIFKNMFDFPFLLSYPDLTTPGLNDAHRDSMLSGFTPTLYEYAYRRYQDPRYLAMINTPAEREYLAYLATNPAELDPKKKSVRYLNVTHIGSAPPSLLFDLDPKLGEKVPPSPSVNYAQVGIGILRTNPPAGGPQQSLIMSSGPSASHGHPDKLHLDLYALGDVLMPSPGVNFPYAGNTRIPRWYHTSVAHNTLSVDEKPQTFHPHSPNLPDVFATQLVYAPGETIGVQRAWTNTAYPGITMDRAVVMTQNYMADIFGAFSAEPHKFDLAWHIRGEPTSSLVFAPMTFPEPVANGYNTLTNVRQASTGPEPMQLNIGREGKVARLHMAVSAPTQAILGDSGFYVDDTSTDRTHKPTCLTILERREGAPSTIYGNALDFSDDANGYVKKVMQEGNLDAGYALLNVTTPVGTDLCFTAFRPGTYKASGLETDALQAFVQMNGKDPQALLLGGGKTLKAAGASLTRSEPGLALIEKVADAYVLANKSPSEATLTVDLPALAGLSAHMLDANGKQGAAAEVTKGATPSSFSIKLAANSAVQFSK